MENIYLKIRTIIGRDGIYQKDDLFIVDKHRFFEVRKNGFKKRYKKLSDCIDSTIFYDCNRKWKSRSNFI